MSDLSTRPCGSRRRSDPTKRVNYTTGLVLGEDEFVQDQVYLRERDHLGVRALHGYGTVSGLGVTWDAGSGQIKVAPGLAVDPAGRLVCVPTEQCAELGRWLTDHRASIEAASGVEEGELPDELSLYVVLCYRECETDTVPVPSESCRPADESMAASRIRESFDLRLRLAPPGSAGEVAGDALAEAIGRLLEIAADEDEDGEVDVAALRRELVAWATTARPEVAAERACLAPPEDDCGERTDEPSTAVLLARVDLGLSGGTGGTVAPVDPEVDDDDRPVLLSTRFLQEWLHGLVSHPDLFAPGDHSVLENLDADDHPQYLLVDGSRPMAGSLNAGANVILNLRRSNGPSHAMRRDEIVGGDLDRTEEALRIVALQGERVDASGDDAPSTGDVLRYDGTRWTPATITAPTEPPPPSAPAIRSVLPFVTIEGMGQSEAGAVFLLWFNVEVPTADVALAPVEGSEPLVYGTNIEILTETCDDGRPALRRIASNRVSVSHVSCNVARVEINREQAQFLRFLFQPGKMLLDTGATVADFAEERGIAWVGQAEDGSVTKFVVNPSPATPFDRFEDIREIVSPAGGIRIPIERR